MTGPLCSTGITPLHHYYRAVRPSPVHRYFGLAVVAACAFSLTITGQVLTFRTKAQLSFAPSTCRMPLGRYQGIPRADPGGRVNPQFSHHLTAFDTSLTVCLRSPPQPCLTGSCPNFYATLTTMAFDHSSLRWLEINT